MTLAEVTFEGDLNAYVSEAFLFILLLGGALFLLSTLVLGQSPVSSSSSRRQKDMLSQDILSAPSVPEKPPHSRPLAKKRSGGEQKDARERRTSLRRGGSPVDVLVSDAVAAGEPVPGVVVNRS